MEEYFNTLLQETERRMAAAAAGMEGKETVATCREMVSYLKAKNRELKAYALARPFSGNEEEIRYFKYYKPALTGRSAVLLPGISDRERLSRLPAGSRNVLPQGDGTSRADDGTLPALLPVLPQRGDIPGRLLFPAGEGRTQPRKRRLRTGRGSGVLHGLRHTGGTPDLGGDLCWSI